MSYSNISGSGRSFLALFPPFVRAGSPHTATAFSAFGAKLALIRN